MLQIRLRRAQGAGIPGPARRRSDVCNVLAIHHLGDESTAKHNGEKRKQQKCAGNSAISRLILSQNELACDAQTPPGRFLFHATEYALAMARQPAVLRNRTFRYQQFTKVDSTPTKSPRGLTYLYAQGMSTKSTHFEQIRPIDCARFVARP